MLVHIPHVGRTLLGIFPFWEMGSSSGGFPLAGLSTAPTPQVFHDVLLLPLTCYVFYACSDISHRFFFFLPRFLSLTPYLFTGTASCSTSHAAPAIVTQDSPVPQITYGVTYGNFL